MIQICKYNKDTDIQKTIPNLAMSIDDAMNTGIITSTGTEIPYTNINDVSEVGSYLNDPIDIAMAAKKLGQSMSAIAAAEINANPKGENA